MVAIEGGDPRTTGLCGRRRRRSLSAAARRLRLSQSALSQTIQSLERQVGVQLLLRSRTGVTTTEAGAILLREGRALIAQHDRMLTAVAGRDGAGPDILKVGIPLELLT
jgi:DNA-binding transcriptional LysR family regulator